MDENSEHFFPFRVIQWMYAVVLRKIEVSAPRYFTVAIAALFGFYTLLLPPFAILIEFFCEWPAENQEIPSSAMMVLDFFGYVFFAPVVETLIIALLVSFANGFTDRKSLHIFAAAVPLGLLHGVITFEPTPPIIAIGSAVVSTAAFLVFSAAFVVWRTVSFRKAFCMSSGIHAVNNLVPVVGMLIAASVGTESPAL